MAEKLEDRKKIRGQEQKQTLKNRLCRIEGQVRGLQSMVDRDVYCPEILNQVAAVKAALDAFGRELLACHIRECVAQDIRDGREESIDELLSVLQRLLR